jgi:hypothetical protein
VRAGSRRSRRSSASPPRDEPDSQTQFMRIALPTKANIAIANCVCRLPVPCDPIARGARKLALSRAARLHRTTGGLDSVLRTAARSGGIRPPHLVGPLAWPLRGSARFSTGFRCRPRCFWRRERRASACGRLDAQHGCASLCDRTSRDRDGES